MSYITTYIGNHFDPAAPEVEAIDMRDIAHALSLTCRGNGHVQRFFSVGEHCINCALEAEARGHSRRVVLGCLLHDATEAYMSDVPRPFKHVMPEYCKAEEKLVDMIYAKYLGTPLDEAEKKLVKQIDDDMLYYDLIELLHVQPEGEPPKIHIELNFEVVPFEEVENTYLNLYHKWKLR